MDYLVEISGGVFIHVADIDYMTNNYVVLMDKTVIKCNVYLGKS